MKNKNFKLTKYMKSYRFEKQSKIIEFNFHIELIIKLRAYIKIFFQKDYWHLSHFFIDFEDNRQYLWPSSNLVSIGQKSLILPILTSTK